jgi:large exoprotein involved in heme utilization and adhesion
MQSGARPVCFDENTAVNNPAEVKMQRRHLLKNIAALAVTTQISILRSVWAAGSKLAPPGFYKIQGKVTLNGRPAREGMKIKPGDIVATGADSEAIYVIGQDAYLQRDNSTVTIAGDKLQSGLRILSGKLLSVFGTGNKRLETSTATIGIRGTGCYIESEAKKVYFCLCYGTADIASIKDEKHLATIQTQHHDQPLYLYADGRQMMAHAAVVNHSDAELIMLENLVGRLPPFVGKTDYVKSY